MKPFDPIPFLQALQLKAEKGEITPGETLTKMNEMRENIGLDPLTELPRSWHTLFEGLK
jgi:hypothetical protein